MARRPIAAFMTDFGADSFYVGAMKAALLATNPDVAIVDVTHSIPGFDVAQAGFVLDRVLTVFPPRTVIVAVVDPGVGGPRRNLIFEVNQRFVLAPDNGLISEVTGRFPPERCVAIQDEHAADVRVHTPRGATFLGRDVFAPVAGALCGGANPLRFGDVVRDFMHLELRKPEVRVGRVSGHCRFVDVYGNMLTDITAEMIEVAFPGVPLTSVSGTVEGRVRIEGIRHSFIEGRPNAPMLLINSWGLVEVAVNRGSAARCLDAGVGVSVALGVDE